MIYLIIVIVLITTIILVLSKNFLNTLKITSIVSGISGITTIVLGYLLKGIISSKINFINLTRISNYLLSKFLQNAIILLLLSLIEIIIYILLNAYYLNKSDLKKTPKETN